MEEGMILPLGTVVLLKSNETIKVMIVSRCYTITLDGEKYYFEYAGCPLPKGIVGNALANFNTEDIKEVLYQGFIDDAEIKEQQVIKEWLSKTDAKKANSQLISAILLEKTKKE